MCIGFNSLFHFTSNHQVTGKTIAEKWRNSRARNPKGWNCQRTFLNKALHVVLLRFLLRFFSLRILLLTERLPACLPAWQRGESPSSPPPETNEMVSVPGGRLCYDTDSTYFMGKLPRVHMCLCLSSKPTLMLLLLSNSSITWNWNLTVVPTTESPDGLQNKVHSLLFYIFTEML